jgi:uncharacterized protein YjbI with pentapeptide repeats
MFTVSPCAAGCGRAAISGSNICYTHQANPEQEILRITQYIAQNKSIKDISVAGMRFENIDFSRRQFYGCNFREAVFLKCILSETSMRMSFFDFADFDACDFSKSDLQFLSFAGARFRSCIFDGSELVHVNFIGASVSGTSFNNSNLYNSRFINAELEKSQFIDCNLKKTWFIGARQNEIEFKSSNTAEAVFEMEE